MFYGAWANAARFGETSILTAVVKSEVNGTDAVVSVVKALPGCSGIFEEAVVSAVPSLLDEVVHTRGLAAETIGV